MRFSIRDLLWATLVVAMGLGWWATNTKRLEAVQQAHRQRATLLAARYWHLQDYNRLEDLDWSVLGEPLVEP